MLQQQSGTFSIFTWVGWWSLHRCRPILSDLQGKEIGHHPEIILAGQQTNDEMPFFVADTLIAEFVKRRVNLVEARILVLGVTFKENCPDIRNSKVIDLIQKNLSLAYVLIYDPHASKSKVQIMYGLELIDHPTKDIHSDHMCCCS